MTGLRCIQAPQGRAAEAASRYRAALPRLETERLVLRAPTMDDFGTWRAIFAGDTDGFIGGPLDTNDAYGAFVMYMACWMLHGHGPFTVTARADQRVLGFVHLGLELGDDEPELGYFFTAEARGLGYATEAARAVRRFGAELLGPGTFVSYVDPKNTRSAQLAQRLGAVLDTAETARTGTDVWRYGVPS